MTLATFTEVWTPLSIAAAVLPGLAFGYFAVGWLAIHPRYSTGLASGAEIGGLTFILTAGVALLFFAFQAAATYAVHDPAWPRVVSRYGTWVIFAAAIGLAAWARIRRDRRQRRARAHDRALAEKRP